MFGTEMVLEVLNRDPCAAPERAIRKMSEAVGEFAGRAEQFDDLTMLCFEYKG
jgi:sigma-B regulation protein RsbU (phosphoserine phosphatase)